MKETRRFVAPMGALEAANRADYILTHLRYRPYPGDGMRYQRSFAGAALVVVHPHHVYTTVTLTLTPRPDGATDVTLELMIQKFGQPVSSLDKAVWFGELDDLQAALEHRRNPTIDRFKQNDHAGKMSVVFIVAAIVVSCLVGLAAIPYVPDPLLAVAVGICALLLAVAILPRIPFRMPHFPLENPMPEPPFDSNYPRTGRGAL